MSLKLEAVKKGNGNLLLRFAYANRTRKYFGTGVTIPAQDFNPKNILKPVKCSNPECSHYNKMVGVVYDRINDTITKIRREDKVETADYVYSRFHEKETVEAITRNSSMSANLIPAFLAYRNYDSSTLKLYHTTFKHFESCFGNIDLTGFSLIQWNQFREFLFVNKKHIPNTINSVNTVCIRLKKLKCFLRHIRANDGVDFKMKTFPIPKEEIKKISLDLESLNLIQKYQPHTEAMRNIKDMCLFQCFTGLRISDLKRVNEDHIVKDNGKYYILMKAYKTGNEMVIPLGEVALEILKRHEFVLPVVADQYYNREIKSLLRLAGITKVVEWMGSANGQKKMFRANLPDKFTNHCCSRTAIAYFFEQNFTPSEVATIVGKSLDTIMKYYLVRSSPNSIMGRQREMTNKVASEPVHSA